jgi:hypothetical protein
MADNKVIIELLISEKGKKVSMVEKQTAKLTETTKKHRKAQKDSTKEGGKYHTQQKAIHQTNLSSAKGFSKMNQTIGEGGSSGLVGAYATLAANVFAATAAFNALRQASQVQQLVEGLEALGRASGDNLTLLADRIKDAAGQAIALDQALRVASVGASAGFSGEQLEGLATVARSAAIALGRDVGDAIDRLARGAAKLEPEILDELGIFVRLDDASAKYAASIGVATSELTRFQQRQAFANEIIEQGGQKFSEIGNNVDVSPFDALAATLGDLSRTFTDFFNTVLGPIASFFSNNTIALTGFFMAITKGIMNQALPMLNQFAASAQRGAMLQVKQAQAAGRRIDKEIQGQRNLLKPIKNSELAYNQLFGKMKQGTATAAELKLMEQSLAKSIRQRQAALLGGSAKTLAARQAELATTVQQQQELQKLIKLENSRAGKTGDIRTATAGAKSKRSEQAVFRELDKDPSFKGYMRAFGLSGQAQKKYRKNLGDSINSTKLFGFNLGFLGKAANKARPAIFGFGLTSKIAIKGIFTAIPVIGQLLFALDLLIVGLKNTIKFFAGFRGEASRLEKATDALNSQTQFYAETQSASAEATKNMSESLLTSSKATAELLNTTREFSVAQEESRKKSTVFGKVLQGAFVNINFVWKLFTTAFNGFDGILERIGIRFQMFAIDAVKDLRFLLNLYIRATNLMNRGTGIEPIELISAEGQEAKLEALKNRLKEMTVERTKLATASTLAIFGKQAVSSAELESFTTVLQSGGAAAKELQEFLGTDNINKFAQQIAEANSSNSLAGFSPAIQKVIENLGLMEDGTISSAEIITLLSSSLENGTKNTIDQGDAINSLGETFKNSGQKINEFLNSFNKTTSVTTFNGLLKTINDDFERLDTQTAGAAIFQQFEGANASFKSLVSNGETLAPLLEKQKEELKKISDAGGKVTDKVKEEIAIRLGIPAAIKTEINSLENLVGTINKALLFDKARLDTLKQQEQAVSKQAKMNASATAAQITLSNQQTQINLSRLQNEAKLQEQTLGLTAGQFKTESELAEMTSEEQQKYATLLEKRVEIGKQSEKQIGTEEELALIGLQANALATAQLATIKQKQAFLATELKTTQILSNVSKGLGGKLSPAQQLEAQKKLAQNKIKNFEDELALLNSRLAFEITIADARLTAAGVDKTIREEIIADLKEQQAIQADILGLKVKGAKEEAKTVGASNFTGLLSTGTFADQNTAAETAKTELDTTAGGTTQGKLEIMNEFMSPMRDALSELGPGGDLINAAQEGILTLAAAFDVVGSSTSTAADKMAAVGAAVTAISAIMQASSKAQVAEIDNQIKAEKQRDGKSKESVSKIAAMEKKKEGIQRKAFEQKKKMDIASAVISTALGAARSMEMGGIIGPILAAMTIAMGMAQVAIIKKQQFQGSSGEVSAPNTALQLGKRSNRVDISKEAGAGEASYLRGGQGVGSNANNFTGMSMGKKGYANGGEGIVVGERGPEVIAPSEPVDIIPNFALGGQGQNITFNINAVDGQSVQNMLMDQQGTIVGVIRDAANSYGEDFLPDVNIGYDMGGS